MYDHVNRRDFLVTTGLGLPFLLSQTPGDRVNEQQRRFDAFREYAIRLHEDAKIHNDQEYERQRAGQIRATNLISPKAYEGFVSGRRADVRAEPTDGSYSLETTIFFNESDLTFTQGWSEPEKSDFPKLFISGFVPAAKILDMGSKGNILTKQDYITVLSINGRLMEYSVYTGDGSYYLSHFTFPEKATEEESSAIRQKAIGVISELEKTVSASDNIEREYKSAELIDMLTSLDGRSQRGRGFNFLPIFSDGFAWYAPSGAIKDYYGMLFNLGPGFNVGNQ